MQSPWLFPRLQKRALPARALLPRAAALLLGRKLAMPAEQWARFEKLCKPIRALLPIGSRKGSVGLWLF
jgi:hypothetical protein